MNALKFLVIVNMYMLYIFTWMCLNTKKKQINVNIILWPRMKLIKWLWIINSNKYMHVAYLIRIKCMIDLFVTKVFKSISLFNSKLMITSITHRIMDAKLYDYWFMCN